MFERKYREGAEVPAEEAAMADLERSIVAFEHDIECGRSNMRRFLKDAMRQSDGIDDTVRRKKALEEALEKLRA